MHFRYLVIGILEYTLKTKLYLAQELKISETEDLKKINLEDYKDWEWSLATMSKPKAKPKGQINIKYITLLL